MGMGILYEEIYIYDTAAGDIYRIFVLLCRRLPTPGRLSCAMSCALVSFTDVVALTSSTLNVAFDSCSLFFGVGVVVVVGVLSSFVSLAGLLSFFVFRLFTLITFRLGRSDGPPVVGLGVVFVACSWAFVTLFLITSPSLVVTVVATLTTGFGASLVKRWFL